MHSFYDCHTAEQEGNVTCRSFPVSTPAAPSVNFGVCQPGPRQTTCLPSTALAFPIHLFSGHPPSCHIPLSVLDREPPRCPGEAPVKRILRPPMCTHCVAGTSGHRGTWREVILQSSHWMSISTFWKTNLPWKAKCRIRERWGWIQLQTDWFNSETLH